MDLFALKGTEVYFGASYSINDFSLLSHARELIHLSYRKAVGNVMVQHASMPVGRPKFKVDKVDDMSGVYLNISWRQGFAKWANFLQA